MYVCIYTGMYVSTYVCMYVCLSIHLSRYLIYLFSTIYLSIYYFYKFNYSIYFIHTLFFACVRCILGPRTSCERQRASTRRLEGNLAPGWWRFASRMVLFLPNYLTAQTIDRDVLENAPTWRGRGGSNLLYRREWRDVYVKCFFTINI